MLRASGQGRRLFSWPSRLFRRAAALRARPGDQQAYGHAKDEIKKDIDEWYSTLKDVMNWDHIEDNWKQYSATVKEKWGRLTNDQIAEMKGKREQLEAKIQQTYS